MSKVDMEKIPLFYNPLVPNLSPLNSCIALLSFLDPLRILFDLVKTSQSPIISSIDVILIRTY